MLITLGTYEGGIVGYSYTDNAFEQLYGYVAHIGAVKSVASSSKQLATGGSDEVIRIFDLTKLKENGGLSSHAASITSLAIRDDLLLSGAQDGTLCVHELKAGNQWYTRLNLKAHKDSVLSVSIHPSGKMAISIAADFSLKLWDLVRGTCACVQSLASPSASLRILPSSVRLSPSGDSFVLLYPTKVVITSLADGKSVEHPGSFCEVAFLDEQRILVGTIRGEVCILGQQTCLENSPHTSRIKGIEVGENFIVTVCADGTMAIWDKKSTTLFDSCKSKAGRVTSMAVADL